jgi:hypothetical protein
MSSLSVSSSEALHDLLISSLAPPSVNAAQAAANARSLEPSARSWRSATRRCRRSRALGVARVADAGADQVDQAAVIRVTLVKTGKAFERSIVRRVEREDLLVRLDRAGRPPDLRLVELRDLFQDLELLGSTLIRSARRGECFAFTASAKASGADQQPLETEELRRGVRLHLEDPARHLHGVGGRLAVVGEDLRQLEADRLERPGARCAP